MLCCAQVAVVHPVCSRRRDERGPAGGGAGGLRQRAQPRGRCRDVPCGCAVLCCGDAAWLCCGDAVLACDVCSLVHAPPSPCCCCTVGHRCSSCHMAPHTIRPPPPPVHLPLAAGAARHRGRPRAHAQPRALRLIASKWSGCAQHIMPAPFRQLSAGSDFFTRVRGGLLTELSGCRGA